MVRSTLASGQMARSMTSDSGMGMRTITGPACVASLMLWL